MEKIAFIVNPAAQSGAIGRHLPHLTKQILQYFSHASILTTKRPEHASDLAEECLKKAYTIIVAVGGDGTINEVLNGFMQGQQGNSSAPTLAFINLGTGSDLQKSFAIKSNFEHNLQRIKQGTRKLVDIGQAFTTGEDGQQMSRYFLNIASCGLSAEVAKLINQSKHLNGKLAYYWASLRGIFAHKNWPLEVSIDNQTKHFSNVSLLAAANGSFFGGGMHIAPKAKTDDGLLDKIIVSNMNTWFFIKHGWRVYNGSHLKLPQVSCQNFVEMQVKCTSKQKIRVEIEGEVFGALPAKFIIIPKALKLIV